MRKIVKALFDPKKFLAKVDETGIRQSLNVRPACGCVLIMKLRTRFFRRRIAPPPSGAVVKCAIMFWFGT